MENSKEVRWDRPRQIIFTNPRVHSEQDTERLKQIIGELSVVDHLWFSTSGTTSEPKWIALSYQAFLHSAASVNQHLGVRCGDIWLNALPKFHVGGQSIFARAHLSQSRVLDVSEEKWCARRYVEALREGQVVWSSLVPTQAYDLLRHGLQPPPSLKGIVIGGGELAFSTWEKMRVLGWPLYLSYGLTELCSQVATSDLNSRQLKPLGHVSIRINQDGYIQIESKSLMTGYLESSEWSAFSGEYYTSEDLGQLTDDELLVFGRKGGVKKIKGELVSLTQIHAKLSKSDLLKEGNYAAWFEPHERDGHQVVLFHVGDISGEQQTNINALLSPLERIQKWIRRNEIPKTALGKIKYAEL